jgi:hypothetical protein
MGKTEGTAIKKSAGKSEPNPTTQSLKNLSPFNVDDSFIFHTHICNVVLFTKSVFFHGHSITKVAEHIEIIVPWSSDVQRIVGCFNVYIKI